MSPYRWIGDDLEIDVHAQPGARRTEVGGLHGDAIRIRVAAPPSEGRANEALVRFLADALHVPSRRCALVSGQSSRRKRFRIEAPDRAAAERMLAAWLA